MTAPAMMSSTATSSNPLTVRHSVFIDASVEAVYDAFTVARQLDAWFTTGSEVDPVTGGQMIASRFLAWRGDTGYASQRQATMDRMERNARVGRSMSVDEVAAILGWTEAEKAAHLESLNDRPDPDLDEAKARVTTRAQ